MLRQFTLLDKFCLGVDKVVRALTDSSQTSGKPYPAQSIVDEDLSPTQLKHSAGLMRVNHAGEVCAQALYHGQAFVSMTEVTYQQLNTAAIEEGDHLQWCRLRLDELNSHTSYLNPLWYGGSFCMGMLAGMIGDEWSLGFVAETERQVIKHLDKHLSLLPAQDARSAAILQQMEQDEAHHRDTAISLGAKELPDAVKGIMSLVAKIMVKTSYWV